MNKSDISKCLASFRKTLSNNSNPERAEKEKSYLKSPYKFFGVPVPFMEKMAKDFKRENKDIDKKSVFELAERLWDSEYHQEKTLAIKLLQQFSEHLDYESMPMLERMLSESTGWDHVDGISTHLVEAVLRKDRKAYGYLKKWSKSENFWMRRASLISQILLFREGNGDKELFFSFAERMIGEKEFFIRKAIGWGLRDMSKVYPDAVFGFLMKFKGKASGLTLREGSKRLPESKRKTLLGKMASCNLEFRAELKSNLWDQLAEIFRNSPMSGRTDADLKAAFENSTIKCFAFSKGKLIGCGRALSDEVYQAVLYDIVVHQDFRNSGAGTAIVKHLIDRIKAKNIILYAVPGVEAFYGTLGFKKLKTAMGYFRSSLGDAHIGYVEP